MYRSLCLLLTMLLLAAAAPTRSYAQSAMSLLYPAGWNMVGGPVGSEYIAAQALYVYGSTGYVAPAGLRVGVCQGYWAYLPQPVSVQSSNGGSATAQTCSLQAGWNMIGNPFGAPAAVPSGMDASLWNPVIGRYEAATAIPIGAAVWLYAPVATSVTLQAMPGTSSTTVLITPPFTPPYRARVGDIVELQLPGTMGYTARADPAYLQLIDSGATQSYPPTHFWRWRAIAAGSTIISADPACRQSTPPCEIPSIGMQIEITAG